MCGATKWRRGQGFFLRGLSPRVRGNRCASTGPYGNFGPIPACAGQPRGKLKLPYPSRAYPRVCGATSCCRSCWSWPWGLSPRVRGNRIVRRFTQQPLGPIPACAGQPRACWARSISSRAYPRVCGATWLRPRSPSSLAGLSPRVRGNRHRPNSSAWDAGPIPACAGQPPRSQAGRGGSAAYPRVCGATDEKHHAAIALQGLSPRVRGNLGDGMDRHHPGGPIPACAGQPRALACKTCNSRAYPRVCGATTEGQSHPIQALGLSPRVRGNLFRAASSNSSVGPIPACAGQPARVNPLAWRLGAYPRVCGATVTVCKSLHGLLGLSPRVRGNLNPLAWRLGRRGPIPACAGQPFLRISACSSSGAYPRVCGATVTMPEKNMGTKGLSPRVRGNRWSRSAAVSHSGPIPACAGQPSTDAGGSATTRAYPRVCGATGTLMGGYADDLGLSPRVRGNQLPPKCQ